MMQPRTTTFLSPDELRDLTDTHVRALQIEWLQRKNWTYTVSRMGNPKVLRAYAEQQMGMGTAPAGAPEPDFSHWTKAA